MRTCVTVSVNYADFLSIFLKHNLYFFDEVYVLTTTTDTQTHKVCQQEDVHLIKTDAFYEYGDKFNYGRVVHNLFKTFNDKDWIFLMDADIIFPENYENNLQLLKPEQKDIFFGANRYLLNTYEDYQAYLNGQRDGFELDRSWGMGYLQIFNTKNKFLGGELHYENSLQSKHFTDFMFRLKFGWHVFREDSGEHYWDCVFQKCLPPVYHVGKIGNDSNRTSPKFV